MADKALRSWIGDQLHSLMGYSEGHVIDYVASLSKSSKSPAALLAKLHEADVPKSDGAKRFAAELFSRAPRQQVSSSSSGRPGTSADAAAKEQRKEAIGMLKQNAQYGMVSDGDDDDGEDDVTAAVQRALQEKERERQRAQKKRQRDEKEGSRSSKGGGGGESSSTGGQASGGGGVVDDEAAREADLRERDEFAERLRQRDLERTRKAGGAEGAAIAAREAEAAALLSAGTAEEKAAALAEARKVSRRKYLEQRERKMLEAARDDVRDEEFLF